jgi:pimeloyl-ACP methyl ester carboxylesterase
VLQAAGYRILAPDARGFGRSTYPGGSSIHDMAADVAELLEHLSIHNLDVVGISMGGTLALQLALDYPERVKKLVLVNTFASLRPRQPSVWLYFIFRFALVHTLGLPTQARAVALRIFPQSSQESLRQELIRQIVQADPRGYRAAMRALGRFNVSKQLHRIASPTLVVTGERDTTVPAENQRMLAAGIKHATQVVIPEAGHAVTAEKPETFNSILVEFLTSPDR